MIAFDLHCGGGHSFEGWFSSSKDYDQQRESGLLACPMCGDLAVGKALSVPNIGRKGNQTGRPSPAREQALAVESAEVCNAPALPPAMMELMQRMASAQSAMLKESEWVGRAFAENARAIHYGESEHRLIHGEVSQDEAEALAEEGVPAAPLPFPVVPPQAKN